MSSNTSQLGTAPYGETRPGSSTAPESYGLATDRDEFTEQGLRSSLGVRWLSLIGALVVGVSLVRLVSADWQAWPPALQALSLILGSLGLFGLGHLTRFRLRLSAAGSAILGLAASTLPILAWGAASHGLLALPWGLPVFLFGWTSLLFAFHRTMGRLYGYQGWIFPTALGTALLAMPILPRLFTGASNLTFLLQLAALGAVFRLGSRHINRFFFHRDRLAQLDRPLNVLPFALLGLTYAAAVALLRGTSGMAMMDLALALIFLGLVFVDTGEEYFRAVQIAHSRALQAWPRRSVWLLTAGFLAMASGGTIALMSGQALAISVGGALGAARLWHWAVRYQKPVAYGAALLASIVAAHTVPAALGWPLPDAGATGLWHLGLFGVLIVAAALGRQRGHLSDPLRDMHAAIVMVHAIAFFAYALSAAPIALSFAIATAVMILLAAAVLQRNRPLVAFWFVSFGAISTLAISDPVELWCLGLLTLGASAFGHVQLTPWIDRRMLIYPAILTAILTAIVSPFLCTPSQAGGLTVLATLSLWNAAALQRQRPLFELSALSLWSSILLLAWAAGGNAFSPLLALAAQGLLTAFWLARKHLSVWTITHSGAELGLHLGLTVNACLIGIASFQGLLTIEPLAMLLVGVALLRQYLGASPSEDRALALRAAIGLLAIFAPLQLSVVTDPSWANSLLISGAVLAAFSGFMRHPSRTLNDAMTTPGRSVEAGQVVDALGFWEVIWIALASSVCLTSTGTTTLILSLAIVGIVLLRTGLRKTSRAPGRGELLATFLPVIQLAAWKTTDFVTFLNFFLPTFLLGAWIWQQFTTLWTSRQRLRAYGYVLDGISLIAIVLLSLVTATEYMWLTVLAIPLLRAATYLHTGWRERHQPSAWLWQGWIAVTGFVGVAVDLFPAIGLAVGYGALLVAIAELVLREFCEHRQRPWMARPCLPLAIGSALFGGVYALGHTLQSETLTTASSPWLTLLPTFLASLFFLWLAREADFASDEVPESGSRVLTHYASEWRVAMVGIAMTFFALAVPALFSALGTIPSEFYWLGPGIALITLARLLEREMGRRISQWVFSAGALCLYAMPIFGSLDQLSWTWQGLMLLLAIGFGAASFHFRSPSLLVLSTCAVVVDLTFFVLKLHQDAPLAIWILGVILGLGLMAASAVLEHRREHLLQQLRLWGDRLRAWA